MSLQSFCMWAREEFPPAQEYLHTTLLFTFNKEYVKKQVQYVTEFLRLTINCCFTYQRNSVWTVSIWICVYWHGVEPIYKEIWALSSNTYLSLMYGLCFKTTVLLTEEKHAVVWLNCSKPFFRTVIRFLMFMMKLTF